MRTWLLAMIGLWSGSAVANDDGVASAGATIALDKMHLHIDAAQQVAPNDGQAGAVKNDDIDVLTVKNLTDRDLRVQITLEADAGSAGFMLVPNRTVVGPYGDQGSGGSNTVTIPANGWVSQIVTLDAGTGDAGTKVGHLTVTVLDEQGQPGFKGQAVLEGTVTGVNVAPAWTPSTN